jgi:hypothetical protein
MRFGTKRRMPHIAETLRICGMEGEETVAKENAFMEDFFG